MKEKYENMLEQGKSLIESGKQNEGLALIKEGLVGLKDDVSFGHCMEVGMAIGNIRKSLKLDWHRVATFLFQKCLDNDKGIKFLEDNGQQQVVMMIRGLVDAAKGELGESIDNICHSAMRFLMED